MAGTVPDRATAPPGAIVSPAASQEYPGGPGVADQQEDAMSELSDHARETTLRVARAMDGRDPGSSAPGRVTVGPDV